MMLPQQQAIVAGKTCTWECSGRHRRTWQGYPANVAWQRRRRALCNKVGRGWNGHMLIRIRRSGVIEGRLSCVARGDGGNKDQDKGGWLEQRRR